MPEPETAPAATPARPLPILRSLRVHQWTKNLLVFVPAVLDHRILDGPVMLGALLAFAAFSLAASGGYVLNDLLDRSADRAHPLRRQRPFADGSLSTSFGVMLLLLLFGLALLLAWLTLPGRFLALLAGYVILTAAYSAYLKRFVVLDVLMLAGFYTLRVLAGLAATPVRFSTWLIAFSMFLFLSLAFVKRYAELTRLATGADSVLARRGYQTSDREWLGTMGAASGYLSVLVLALYINSDEVTVMYRTPMLLWLLCPVLLYWISRAWLQAHRGRMAEDPIVATLRDPLSYVIGAVAALILVAAS
jgi:4-hydroxybenzoate polyprenyltransferase